MNSAYVEDLYFEFLRDPESVTPEWRTYFASYQPEQVSGKVASILAKSAPEPVAPSKPTVEGTHLPSLGPNDELIPLSSIGGRIAENMMQSLTVPTATSVRSVPVKALEENRRIINNVLARQRKSKLSFTHILAWAIVKALEKVPNMQNTYGLHDGIHVKVQRGQINLGLAVDTTRKDGSRILLVPSIKNAGALTFDQFAAAYDTLINKARTNKLTPEDLMGATVTLTNPGMIGTVMSVPRLMDGQGTIIAAGSIEFPAEFQAMMPDVLSSLAVSKVVTITSTYDHRVIQGAESGEFLQIMHRLLAGQDRFYDQIFAALKIPFEPYVWERETHTNPFEPEDKPEILDKEARVMQMIHAYRVRGHLLADVNPLGYEAHHYPELDPSNYGFTIWDLDREYDTGGLAGRKRATLRDIIDLLRSTYCDRIGVEYMHIHAPEKREWIRARVEQTQLRATLTPQQRLDTYKKLVKAESLENFLHTKFLGAKRFSLEGGEAALTIIDELLENAADNGMSGSVIGMAHRGRLNVLVNMLRKPLEKLFNEFEGNADPNSVQGSGDVKYHLGAKGTFLSDNGNPLPMVLAPNPSHLEAVDPVVEGIARAMTDLINDETHTNVLPILVHGDAAFAGQGVVYETLNMSKLAGYSTGGTAHVIINNQIGFTTSPEDSRSTHYATALAKMLHTPILHVNGDDPEACRAAAQFAWEYRQQFHDDVVIDMYCYRKYGHNEQDDPTATQPLLYKKIKNHVPVRRSYGQRLVAEKVATDAELQAIQDEIQVWLQTAFDNRASQGEPVPVPRTQERVELFAPVNTAVDRNALDTVMNAICDVPSGFNIHAKVKAEVDKRRQQYGDGVIQWATAEALAWGSLMLEGHGVRITGQDSGRGTFNHRQAVQKDTVNETRHVPLNDMVGAQRKLCIYDSPLSEYAVLGYEYGYSTIAKNDLTIWEAQFGDFVNGAQIVIDQFISSAEEKWGQVSNLVMLLPHGYDGQGPEHSSARMERFLQLAAEDNMFVCNFTSPANFFHALRRQVKAPYRKPLIVMTPKGYLRTFASTINELTDGTFREFIDDASVTDRSRITRVVLCSGKVANELDKRRAELKNESAAVIRVEQIAPFHREGLRSILATYPNLAELVWAQEEPKNMGSWFFVNEHLFAVAGSAVRVAYVGRPASASPATGSAKKHEAEQDRLLTDAFSPLA